MEAFSFTHTATDRVQTSASEGGGPGGAQRSSCGISCCWCSVSACALAPVACVVDVEEGLGLPEVGHPLGHVGHGKLRVGACSKVTTNKSSEGCWRRTCLKVRKPTCLLADERRLDFGEGGDGSVLGAMHGGLPVDVQMRVRCAVQGTEPLGCGCLGLRQL